MVIVSLTRRPLSPEARAAYDAATEEDIQRWMEEDGDVDLTDDMLARIRLVPPPPDARAIREKLGMSAEEFSEAFGIDRGLIDGWEVKGYLPDGPAATLLRVIEHAPDAVRAALAPR